MIAHGIKPRLQFCFILRFCELCLELGIVLCIQTDEELFENLDIVIGIHRSTTSTTDFVLNGFLDRSLIVQLGLQRLGVLLVKSVNQSLLVCRPILLQIKVCLWVTLALAVSGTTSTIAFILEGTAIAIPAQKGEILWVIMFGIQFFLQVFDWRRHFGRRVKNSAVYLSR